MFVLPFLNINKAEKILFIPNRATEGEEVGTATVTLSVTNKLEFSAATLTGCAVAGAAASKIPSHE